MFVGSIALGHPRTSSGLEIPDDASCVAVTESDCASPTPPMLYPDNQLGLEDTPDLWFKSCSNDPSIVPWVSSNRCVQSLFQ